jgi:hypothetical protein
VNFGVPGARPGCQTCLKDRCGWCCLWRRFGLRRWFLQAGAVAGDGTLDRFGQVVPQVPPVGDLDG